MYSSEEIKKIAPRYKGKPENFDPEKMGKSRQRRKRGPQTAQSPPPTNLQMEATRQRNDTLIWDEIFDIDMLVIEILPRQSFQANYSKIVDLVAEVYDGFRINERKLDRQLVREELSYYATALLQLKLLKVKAEQGGVLTNAEEDLLEAVHDDKLNIPWPIFVYLNEIGTYFDKMAGEMRVDVPALPITVVQGQGGYHAAAVTTDNHNLFEEVPSLGIAGDMLMALASPDDESQPNFRVGRPEHTQFSNNLVGKFYPISRCRPEIKGRLAHYGITANEFKEYVPKTRFNLQYIRLLSDIIGKFETYEKMTFRDLGMTGGETQVVFTKPLDVDEPQGWRERSVQATSASNGLPAIMGASCCFGFQLFKEDGPGKDRNAKTANWSCITGIDDKPWIMPDSWYDNRNARRDLSQVDRTERFRAISIRQDLQLSNVVRRMNKTLH